VGGLWWSIPSKRGGMFEIGGGVVVVVTTREQAWISGGGSHTRLRPWHDDMSEGGFGGGGGLCGSKYLVV